MNDFLKRHGWTLATAVTVAAGIVLRLAHVLRQYSLWEDELSLALNTVTRSYSGLLTRLAYGQSAALPFLWGQHFMTQTFGVQELSLRALPLLAGSACLLLTWRMAGTMLPPPQAWLATALVALSPQMVRYSNSAKPYAIDGLVTVVLVLLTMRTLRRPEDPVPWRQFLFGGAVAIVFSPPAGLVLSGALLALLSTPSWRGRPETVRRLVTACALWGVLFVVNYWVIFYAEMSSVYTKHYWPRYYLSLSGRHGLTHDWQLLSYDVWSQFLGETVQEHGYADLGFIGIAAIGVFELARRRGKAVALLVGIPLVAAIVAAFAHVYPAASRTLLFTAPLVAVLVAAGVGLIANLLPSQFSVAVFPLLGGLVLVPSLVRAYQQYQNPRRFAPNSESPREYVQRFLEASHDSAVVYVFSRGAQPWLFYTTDWTAPDTARLEWARRILGNTESPFWTYPPPRGHPVADEGGELVRDYRGWRELFGVPTSHVLSKEEGTEGTEQVVRSPEPGWPQNEVRRILAEHRPNIWLFFNEAPKGVYTALTDELEAHGAKRLSEEHRVGVFLFHYRAP